MKASSTKNILPKAEEEKFLPLLEQRFNAQMHLHKKIKWADVKSRLQKRPEKLYAIHQMEITGGEPDVVCFKNEDDGLFYFDCATETPKERRSICYDAEALISRKEHKPRHSAMGMAEEMGVNLLTEAQYRFLQSLAAFDCKTSSWIATPAPIRKLGGALFCDRRYNAVFTYHNGAESYYAARGFRAAVQL